MPLPALTPSIEEEYQLIDPKTRQLSLSAPDLLKKGEEILPEGISEA